MHTKSEIKSAATLDKFAVAIADMPKRISCTFDAPSQEGDQIPASTPKCKNVAPNQRA